MMNWNLNLPLYLMLYLEKSNNSKTCPTVPARIVQISNVLKSSGSILGAATPDSAHFYCGAGGGGACACAGARAAPARARAAPPPPRHQKWAEGRESTHLNSCPIYIP